MPDLRLLQSGLSSPRCDYVLILKTLKKGPHSKVKPLHLCSDYFFLKINVAAIHKTIIPMDSTNHSSKLMCLPPYFSRIKLLIYQFTPYFPFCHLIFCEERLNNQKETHRCVSCIDRFLYIIFYLRERIL